MYNTEAKVRYQQLGSKRKEGKKTILKSTRKKNNTVFSEPGSAEPQDGLNKKYHDENYLRKSDGSQLLVFLYDDVPVYLNKVN
jgi:hypothetical protein